MLFFIKIWIFVHVKYIYIYVFFNTVEVVTISTEKINSLFCYYRLIKNSLQIDNILCSFKCLNLKNRNSGRNK